MQEKVLEIFELNRGKFLSGQEIADKLGVSRAYVWKIIKKLKENGYEIEGSTNKGYTLLETTDILSVIGIKKHLKTDICIEVLNSVTSTNTLLKNKEPRIDKSVIVANEQTEGKGRQGRSFFSPKNTGIYVSLLILEPKTDNLTIIAAVAVCKAIEEICNIYPKIKWVNDIFIGDRKICGILTEGALSMETKTIDYAVVGTGINIYPTDLNEDLKDIVGFLLNERQNDVKNKILAKYLDIFYDMYENSTNEEIIKEYKDRSFIIGKEVYLREDAVKVLDILDNGSLLIEHKNLRKEELISGEISIKL